MECWWRRIEAAGDSSGRDLRPLVELVAPVARGGTVLAGEGGDQLAIGVHILEPDAPMTARPRLGLGAPLSSLQALEEQPPYVARQRRGWLVLRMHVLEKMALAPFKKDVRGSRRSKVLA